jgi:hypothetical protein
LSVKGNYITQELAGVTCGLWKREEKGAQNVAHLSRMP